MKKVMSLVFLFLCLTAGMASAATLDSVSYPGGDTVETASIIHYAHMENALVCAVSNGQAAVDCSGEVIGYSVTAIYTDSAYQTRDTAAYYNTGERYYTHSVYAYKAACLFGLGCYAPLTTEHSTDGINWTPGN